jgi:uridine nucleosidase
MIPLNVTHKAIVTNSIHTRLINGPSSGAASSQLRHTLSTLISFFKESYKSTFDFMDGPPLHDALTIAYVSQPELFTRLRYRVDVELTGTHSSGQTVADVWGYSKVDDTWGRTGKNCEVATDLDVRIISLFHRLCMLTKSLRSQDFSSCSLIASRDATRYPHSIDQCP